MTMHAHFPTTFPSNCAIQIDEAGHAGNVGTASNLHRLYRSAAMAFQVYIRDESARHGAR